MLSPEREQVSVLAMFIDGQIKPLRFKKAGRVYDVASINLRYATKEGKEKILYFSVSDGMQTHKLVYASEQYRWYTEDESWL